MLPCLSVMMGETKKKTNENTKDEHNKYEESIGYDGKRRNPYNLKIVRKRKKDRKRNKKKKF